MSMEEEHLRELEAIAAGLPADPFGMGALRLLLGTLPNPTQPEVKSAREGAPDIAVGGSGIGQALSLTSSALPGGESGGVIGIVPETFFGQSNLLPNPTLDGPIDGASIGLASTAIAEAWEADYDLTSGSITSIVQNVFKLRGEESNAFSSSALSFLINSDGTNEYNLDLYFEHPNSVLLQDMPILGHLVAAFRVWNGSLSMAALTTLDATVQIEDVTDAVILAESTPFSLKSITTATVRIAASFPAEDLNPAHPVRAILHIKAVKPAGTGADPFILWGEPFLAYSSTQSPGAFMPQLARYEERALAQKMAGDSQYSLLVGDLQNANPNIRFGSGSAAVDTRIRRSGTSQLTIDDASGGAAQLIVSSLVSKPFLSTGTVSIDADQNNWNPTGLHTVGFLRVSGLTAPRTITGLNAGLVNGETLVLSNDTGTSLILSNDNASSTDVNRFRFANATSITIRARGMVLLVYDNSRWRAIAE